MIREGLFKRLKNIENKIKDESKKELKPIKNEEQSEVRWINCGW